MYQNLPPAKRRPPPPPPDVAGDPSPEPPPPALPPRRYRDAPGEPAFNNNNMKNHSNLGESLGFEPSGTDIVAGSTDRSNVSNVSSSRDSNSFDKSNNSNNSGRIHVIPFGRHLQQKQQQIGEGGDDNVVKRDFKSLRSQWENSSPREDRYAAELRKQAQRFSSQSQQHSPPASQQQQQNSNVMPVVFKHSRTPINFSTTYKREPMLPQEATSPASSSSPTISEPAAVSSPLHHVTSNSKLLSTSTSSKSHTSTVPKQTVSPATSQQSLPSSTSPSFTRHINKPVTGSGSSSTQPAVTSPPPPQLPERTHPFQQIQTQQYHHDSGGRLRSNSDASPSQLPLSIASSPQQQQTSKVTPKASPISPSRDRSASEHDILSDRRSTHKTNNSNISNNSGSGNTNANRSFSPSSLPPPQTQGQQSSFTEDIVPDEFPPPPLEMIQQGNKEFAEGSYIGHKNKTTRPIGTYKRSKSAAVLPNDGPAPTNNINSSSSTISGASEGECGRDAGAQSPSTDTHHASFHSSRLGNQHGWTSEISLPTDTRTHVLPTEVTRPVDSGSSPVLRPDSHTQQHQQTSVPVRPARPNANHVRYGSGGGGSAGGGDLKLIDQTSQNTLSHFSPENVIHPSDNLTHTAPQVSLLSSQYLNDNVNNIPRRQPPPLPDSPPYDVSKNVNTKDNDTVKFESSSVPSSHFWPAPGSVASSSSSTSSKENITQYKSSPHQQHPYQGNSVTERQWSPKNVPSKSKSSSPVTNNTTKATTTPPRSPGELTVSPLTLPPRDYQRRESGGPVKSASSSPRNSLDSGITVSSNTTTNTQQSAIPISPAHSRQRSQEELECDQHALELAQHLAGEGADQKLSEVLRLDTTKRRMQFMDGLFSSQLPHPPAHHPISASIVSTASSSSSSSSAADGHPGSSSDRTANTVSSSSSNSKNKQSISHAPTQSLSSPAPSSVSNGSSQNGDSRATDASKDQPNNRTSLPKEYWMSPSKAMLEMEWRRGEGMDKDLTKNVNNGGSLVKQKEELLEKLQKKLSVLKEEKISLQQEIADNDLLGTQVRLQAESRCQSRAERDKFTSFLDDLEKIVRLLLNLSGQLARAENAVQALSPDVDGKLRKLTLDKRERLYAKHEEAKLLKDDLDRRGEQVSTMLKERLLPNQLADYTHFVCTRSQLTIVLQETEDKIALGGEQIAALRSSIPENDGGSNTSEIVTEEQDTI